MSEDNKEQAADNQKPSEEMSEEELSEEELKQVAGGVENTVTINKEKGADKAATAADALIRG